jgi:hypothetical protein
MKRTRIAGLVTGVMLLCVSSSWGQTLEQSIEMGAGVVLRLGMPQAEVFASLRRQYYVPDDGKNGGDKNSYLVFRSAQTPLELLGTLEFKAGKLDVVRKEWGDQNQTLGAPLARAFYSAASALARNGSKLCLLSVGETENQLSEIRTTTITCGKKSIEITHVKTGGREYGMVNEVLSNN